MSRNKRVIMAEKRNAAEDIAAALSLRSISREGSSKFIHGTDEDGDEIVIVWSNGHCIELPEPYEIDERYKKWNVSDLPLPLDSDNVLNVKKEKMSLFRDIRAELLDADSIVNAGDAGREGELIQRWIIKRAVGSKDIGIYRLWVQSLTAKAIKDAYENGLLGTREDEIKVLDNLYDSGRARAIMDKYIGYNYSRLISLTQTDGITVNYGRCKSPLVHAIVERDKEIESFVSEPFSYLELSLEEGGSNFNAVLVDENRSRLEVSLEDRKRLEDILASLPRSLDVEDVKVKNKLIMPPQPYDTLQLQKEMSVKYGYEASKTLEIMEKLYDTYHILSYPRTEARYYSLELKEELKDTLDNLCFGKYKEFVKLARGSFIPDKYFNNNKIADHHALVPVCERNIEDIYIKLSEEERNVYDAVLRNFISLFLPGYEYESIDVILSGGNNLFRAKGKRDIALGFKEIHKDETEKESEKEEDGKEKTDQAIPKLEKGKSCIVAASEIKDSKTKPKSHFTTASLLDYMKLHSIGTGATRDRIISELTERKGSNPEGSVSKKGKYFIATDLGRAMDSVVPDNLKSIEFLQRLEESISDIADGKLRLSDFLEEMRREFKQNLTILKENSYAKISAPKANVAVLGKVKCPVCGEEIRIMSWGYSCSGWRKDGCGCNFSIGKTQYGKSLTESAIKQLIENGETKSVLKGLKGESGKSFDARLSLETGEGGKAKIKPVFDR